MIRHLVFALHQRHLDQVQADEKQAIETAIANLREALKSDDKAGIEAKTAALTEASGKLMERVYAAKGAEGEAGAQAAGGGGASAGKDGDVVDAEFTEVNDKK